MSNVIMGRDVSWRYQLQDTVVEHDLAKRVEEWKSCIPPISVSA